MDARSQAIIDQIHPKMRPSLQVAWEEVEAAMPSNVQAVLVAGPRSFAKSDALYAQGRTAPGPIVTNAPAGESFHNYDLAVDFAMITNGKDDDVVGPHWMTVVSIMKKHGFEWGGDWHSIVDNPHFENRYGFAWEQLLAKYKSGDFIPGTTFVNI